MILLGSAQCSTSPRAELMVFVDTDAHLLGELAAHPEVSPDAVIDSLRIDVLDASNDVYNTNLFLVADSASWPVSFGVAAGATPTSEVRLRIRGFRARFARPGTVNGASTLDPFPEVTIDRLVWAPLPASGTSRTEVVLSTDCLGILPSFASPQTTCVDATHGQSSPAEGLDSLAGDTVPATRAGTWSPAVEVPCVTAVVQGRVCVPGGFSVLGDYDAVGGPNETPDQEPIPLHPAVVSAFLLDRDEFTVGRARQLVLSGALAESLLGPSTPGDPLDQYCTWLGPQDPSNDQEPLNCISSETALLACQLSGGTLPSESQWLHEARGRGEGRHYPWGNDEPLCCTVSASRGAAFNASPECAGSGVEPVESHLPSASCGGLGDRSKDGAVDMAGSVTELLLDDFASYAAPCWGEGILHDPVCQTQGTGAFHTSHGGSWSGTLSGTLSAQRGYGVTGPDFGFRCAYPDASP
jgi:formylglycine-generating enzyme required for sulfatase activity